MPGETTIIGHNADDDFGDFSAFSNGADFGNGSKENNNDVNKESATAEAEDDAFGDFGGSSSNQKQDDDFGFGSFEASGAESSTPQNGAGNADTVDEFGDFEKIEKPVDPEKLETENSSETKKDDKGDDFGDFGGFGAPAVQSNKNGKTPNGVANDDFGDFDAPKQDSGVAADNADDDFGNFDGAGAAEDKLAEKGTAAAAADDEFGDFGDFNETSEPKQENEKVVESAGDDSFGDFGSGVAEESNASKQGASTTTADDDFGDFDGSSKPKQDATALAETAGNDDFGDFDAGDAEKPDVVAAASKADGPSAVKDNAAVADSGRDDDFGDFGDFDGGGAAELESAEQAPASAVPPNDDDDFGDFGDFDAPAPAPAPAPAAAPAPAPAPASSVADDDFGDFDEGAETVAVSVQQVDPTLLKARGVFGRLFAGIDPVNSGDDDNNTQDAKIQSLLSTIDVKNSDREKSRSDSLLTLLEENGTSKRNPSYVVANEGSGLNSHYAAHVRGSFFSGMELETDTLKTRKSNEKYLPDVLPIQLTKLKPQSSATTPEVAAPSSPQATIVSLPPKNDSNGATGAKSSTNVKDLLQQIPDLSYMLQKKLSLPKDK